jgi:hypothetical protein
MKNPRTPALQSVAPRQLDMLLDSAMLRGMSPPERNTVLARLTNLLLEATGVAVEGHDHGER